MALNEIFRIPTESTVVAYHVGRFVSNWKVPHMLIWLKSQRLVQIILHWHEKGASAFSFKVTCRHKYLRFPSKLIESISTFATFERNQILKHIKIAIHYLAPIPFKETRGNWKVIWRHALKKLACKCGGKRLFAALSSRLPEEMFDYCHFVIFCFRFFNLLLGFL